MPELRLVQVDAFADRPFTGNPAAVVPLEEWLSDEAFSDRRGNTFRDRLHGAGRGRRGGLRARWFTHRRVVRVARYLASGHVLIAAGRGYHSAPERVAARSPARLMRSLSLPATSRPKRCRGPRRSRIGLRRPGHPGRMRFAGSREAEVLAPAPAFDLARPRPSSPRDRPRPRSTMTCSAPARVIARSVTAPPLVADAFLAARLGETTSPPTSASRRGDLRLPADGDRAILEEMRTVWGCFGSYVPMSSASSVGAGSSYLRASLSE